MDLEFMSLMVHTCTVKLAAEAVASGSSYGHTTKDFVTTPAATYTLIPCRLRGLSDQEITSTGRDELTVDDKMLYIPADFLPATMTSHDASAIHEVSNVVSLETGAVIESGPYDVKWVKLIGGENHHYQVYLRKAGV